MEVFSHIVSDIVLYVEGVGFVGDGKFTTPEIKFKKAKIGGTSGDFNQVWGAVEELKATAEINVHNHVLYESLAKMNSATLIFKNAISSNDGVVGEINTLRGVFDIKVSERKRGEVYKIDIDISPVYWHQEVGGKNTIEIDHANKIVKINGTDMLEKVRKSIGL